jgi:hypothetical protein
MRVTAFGQDAYWLIAVQNAMAGLADDTSIVKFSSDFPNCVANLPTPETNTILLVDASGQGDMEQIVAKLRARGWKYVVVVAADPSAKEATAVLRRNLGYDYWEKTYDEEDIRKRVKACFDEITAELPLLTKRHDLGMK